MDYVALLEQLWILLFILIPILLSGLVFIYQLKKWPNFLKYPIDGGLKFRGEEIFGLNKNIRGFIIFIICTPVFAIVLLKLLDILSISIGDISDISTHIFILKYMLIGLLYPLGELPNSFIKRRISINPGDKAKDPTLQKVFAFIDNFDSIIACGVGYYLAFGFSTQIVIFAIFIGGLIHLGTDKLMEKIKLKTKTKQI